MTGMAHRTTTDPRTELILKESQHLATSSQHRSSYPKNSK